VDTSVQRIHLSSGYLTGSGVYGILLSNLKGKISFKETRLSERKMLCLTLLAYWVKKNGGLGDYICREKMTDEENGMRWLRIQCEPHSVKMFLEGCQKFGYAVLNCW